MVFIVAKMVGWQKAFISYSRSLKAWVDDYGRVGF
jgi:hypothetical protein